MRGLSLEGSGGNELSGDSGNVWPDGKRREGQHPQGAEKGKRHHAKNRSLWNCQLKNCWKNTGKAKQVWMKKGASSSISSSTLHQAGYLVKKAQQDLEELGFRCGNGRC